MNRIVIVLTVSIVMALSCDDDPGGKSKAPDAPVMVPKTESSDTTAHEIMGIDAQDGPTDRIRLLWKEHKQRRELDHFTVYRSEDPAGLINYFPIARVETGGIFLEDSLYHEYIDGANLRQDVSYHYFVTAVNRDGDESQPSDTVWYQLTDKARLIAPLGGYYPNPETLAFQWEYIKAPLPNGYILRIEDDFTGELVYVEWVEPLPSYDDLLPVHELEKGTLQALFLNSVQYRWRIDYVLGNRLNQGSESNWGTFIIYWGN